MSSTFASQTFASTMQAVDSELGAQGSFGYLGRYRLDRIIGHGAMGAVFEAYDPTLARAVAVKTLQSEDTSTESDFNDLAILQEARVAATLSHPNIVTVFDAGRARSSTLHRDLPYVAMELLQGEDLRQQMRNTGTRMRVREAVALVGKVALALDVAHKKGVLHRDIKPANIFVTSMGQPKILDFGLAKITRRNAMRARAEGVAPGVVGGSPQYMSPELIRAAKDSTVVVDVRSDVYSLGVVLYELLCGQLPFKAPTLELLQERIAHATPPSPLELEPEVPRDLSDLVMRALAKRPEDRFRSAAQFARELKRWGRGTLDAELPMVPGTIPGPLDAGPGAAHIDTDEISETPPARTGRWVLALGVAILLAAAGVWWALPASQDAVARPSAATVAAPNPVAPAPSTPAPAQEASPQPAPPPPASTAAPGPATAPDAAAATATASPPATAPATVSVAESAAASQASVRVRLAVVPWGEVEVDGRKVGVSPPLTALNLKPGNHTVVLRNSDFPPHTVRLKVEPQKPALVQHKFQ